MEPDEAILALRQEEPQSRNPSERVRQSGDNVFVEPERSFFQGSSLTNIRRDSSCSNTQSA
jgi:hypothetical protein